ncbi:MAG TPA: winged helix-turn-helix domain-containing protein, partial [Nitriliruptoraceae bacterium]|nr:winged helix-turn-helix domain-containing protein [Nitriliruptoraceae bacterium]
MRPPAAPIAMMVSDPDVVVDTLTAFRRRLLDLLDEPRSATGLARLVGASRQRVNYHLRALEDAGLVELVEERPRRGVTERFLRRRADVVVVDPLAFAGTSLNDRDRVGIAGVVLTARDLLTQAATVAADAAAANQRVAMATLDTEIVVESPAAMRAMLDEIAR